MTTTPAQVFDRVAAACAATGSPVCVGLDPHLPLLPPGLPGADDVARCRVFLFAILEAIEDVVPVVKPQIAFFEQLGPDGVALYFDVIREAHRRDILVIGDIKRADIGSTAAAYARAHLGPEDGSAADLVTVNPYLGSDGIRPFLEVGRPRGRGVFILTRTSNPSAAELQDLPVGEERLFEQVGRQVELWGSDGRGERGFGDAGAVVGATGPEEAAHLRELLPHTWFLVPGYGAQGGTAADVARTFTAPLLGALISSSRGILYAYESQGGSDFADCARRAAVAMSEELAQATAQS